MTRIAGRRPARGNRVRLLLDGSQSYGAMLELIETTEAELRFENFILTGDEVGSAFADVLRARAEAGVHVRILLDAVGSVFRRRPPLDLLFDPSPARLRVFNPPRLAPSFLRAGRDHRKLLAGDGRAAVAGGLCLGDVWLGNSVMDCSWRDSALLVEGPAVAELEDDFDRMWESGPHGTPFGGEARAPAPRVRRPLPPAAPEARGGVPIRIVADAPGARRTERILHLAFEAAEREILLTSPYFIPTRPIAGALRRAARRGVRVEAILPGTSDHPLVDLVGEQRLGPLLEAGVRVWRWQGPMIHAKTVVVDGIWCLIGSSNLDALSLRRNHELNLEVHGAVPGGQMGEVFERDLLGCEPFTRDHWRRRPLRRRLGGALGARAAGWL